MTRLIHRARRQEGWGGRGGTGAHVAALLLLVLLLRVPAWGQVFVVQGGSSSLYGAHGGSVTIRTPKYEIGLGSGVFGGPQFGGYLRTEYRGYTFNLGDDTVSFRLPTDVFNPSHYFLARGLGMGRQWEETSLYGFIGATSTGFSTPFFRAAQPETVAGGLFFDRQLRPDLRLFSRNIFSERQTSIHGLEWQPTPILRAAVAAGVGANQGYFASSLTAERGWASLTAGYTHAGDRFRRIVVDSPLSAETDRENIQLVLKPKPYLTLTAARQNFLSPLSGPGASLRGSINQYNVTATAAGFLLASRLYDARVSGNRNLGTSLSVGRNITDRVQANANWLISRPEGGSTSTSFVATVREALTPRLSLVQLITTSAGHTTVSFGGHFLSNRFTIGVDYQTVYVPFQTDNPFKQALALTLRFHLFGNLELNAGTYVAPDGRVRYTAYTRTFLYHGPFSAEAPAVVIFHKYLIHGRVTDEEERPIRGAALRIDGEMAFTDSDGEFFVRKRKTGPYRLEVVVSEFLQPGRYEVLSAPTTVTAARDDEATPVLIILRRVRRSAP